MSTRFTLSRPYHLDDFCRLLDAQAPPEIVAEYIVEELDMRDPVDVCMLYARDKVACEGIELPCKPCVGHPHPTSGALMDCGGTKTKSLAALLPTDFRQDVFAAWCGRVFGEEVGELAGSWAIDQNETRGGARYFEGFWWVGQKATFPGAAAPQAHKDRFQTKHQAVREMKRRSLACVPVWLEPKPDKIGLDEHICNQILGTRIPAEAFVPEEPAPTRFADVLNPNRGYRYEAGLPHLYATIEDVRNLLGSFEEADGAIQEAIDWANSYIRSVQDGEAFPVQANAAQLACHRLYERRGINPPAVL